MKQISVLILSLLLFALAIYLFVLEKPVDQSRIIGSLISESGEGFDVIYRPDGTFAIQGKGIKSILSTVTKKLTGKETGLTGRYELKYNPFMGNTLVMEFENGEVQTHRVEINSGELYISGRKMVRK